KHMAVDQISDSNFIEKIKGQTAIIKFYADWCGSCKLIAPKFSRLSEDEAFGDVKFYEVNAEENPEVRKAIGVDNLPYFAAFKEGKLIEGSTSSKIEAIEEMVKKIAG
ncbi:MAG: thioredoxin family protein, partial [Luteibaculum sp.]